MCVQPGVREILFVDRDDQTGDRLDFVFLEDGSCGVARNGVVESVWKDAEAGIEIALGAFREMCRSRPALTLTLPPRETLESA
jgi:hypothetical protein